MSSCYPLPLTDTPEAVDVDVLDLHVLRPRRG